MSNEPNKSSKPDQPGKTGRRKLSAEQRAERLRQTGQNLVEFRVRAILQDDVEWLRLIAQEKEEKREIHHRRLQVTKREQSFESFLDKLKNVFFSLQESQNMELFHTRCLDEVKCFQEIMRERAAARVRRELNLPDPPIAPPMPPEERTVKLPEQPS